MAMLTQKVSTDYKSGVLPRSSKAKQSNQKNKTQTSSKAITYCSREECSCPARYDIGGHLFCGRCCPLECRKKEHSIQEITKNTTSPGQLDTQDVVVFYNEINNQYKYFGSFYEASFKYKDAKWKSAEHAYSAMKFYYLSGKELDGKLFKHCEQIAKASNGLEARKLGKDRTLPIRYDWNSQGTQMKVKDEFMYDIVYAKVSQNSQILKLLLETGDKEIVNGSNEPYWGRTKSDKTGYPRDGNQLGRIYMMVRSELQKSQKEK